MLMCKNSKCSKEHDGSFGKGIFCSRACANSRIFTKESNEKKRKAMLGKPNVRKGLKLSVEEASDRKEKITKTYSEKRKLTPFQNLSYRRKRKLIIEEQGGQCFVCGISEWNNLPITLEIDHRDNNKKNNLRENLAGLCPNCHSQTIGWRKGWKDKD